MYYGLDCAAMGRNGVVYDSQSESCAAGFASTSAFYSIESLE